MNVYVSMSSKDLSKARARMDLIRNMGHDVVLDWTTSFDELVPKSEWPRLTMVDVDKVVEADVVVLFGEPTAGCFVELGAAIAARKPVVWVYGYADVFDNRHFFLNYPGAWAVSSLSELSGFLEFLANTKQEKYPSPPPF